MNKVVQIPVANQMHDLLTQMNAEFAVVPLGSSICILRETQNPSTGAKQVTFLTVSDFKTLTKNLRTGDETSAAEFFLTHAQRREYRLVDFYPGTAPDGVYNLWRGFSVQPRQGKADLFWKFVREVTCAGNARAYVYVRKWLAHLVQRPHEMPEVALVQRGLQGTGKNFFADTVGSLIADHYLAVSNLDKITGRFNGHLAHVLVVHANEAIWGGMKSAEGALKALITDSWLAYEFKNKDITQMRNFKRLIVSSNEDWAVPRSADDRRFFVLDVSDMHKEDHAYFRELREELESGGREAIMYDLMHEDISNFDPRQMPGSSAGFDMKLKSASSVEKWLFELLNGSYRMDATRRLALDSNLSVNTAGERKTKDEIYASYAEFCSSVERTHPEPNSQFWKKLKRIVRLKEERCAADAKGHRQRLAVLPPLSEARAQFESYFKQSGTIQWEVEDSAAEDLRRAA